MRFAWQSALALMIVALGVTGAALAQQPAQPPGVAAMPKPVPLTERDMEQFLALAEEFQALGLRADALARAPGGDAAAMALGMEAMAAMQRHGFDPQRFKSVASSIALALAGADAGLSDAELDAARRQLEALKGEVPDEQYAMLERQLLGSFAMVREQPPENIELVAKYRDRLEKLGQMR